MIDTLAGAKFLSTLDLISAYHSFEIHPDDREKTAFSTKQGHWQWKRVSFGLCNEAPFFVRQIACGKFVIRNDMGRTFSIL